MSHSIFASAVSGTIASSAPGGYDSNRPRAARELPLRYLQGVPVGCDWLVVNNAAKKLMDDSNEFGPVWAQRPFTFEAGKTATTAMVERGLDRKKQDFRVLQIKSVNHREHFDKVWTGRPAQSSDNGITPTLISYYASFFHALDAYYSANGIEENFYDRFKETLLNGKLPLTNKVQRVTEERKTALGMGQTVQAIQGDGALLEVYLQSYTVQEMANVTKDHGRRPGHITMPEAGETTASVRAKIEALPSDRRKSGMFPDKEELSDVQKNIVLLSFMRYADKLIRPAPTIDLIARLDNILGKKSLTGLAWKTALTGMSKLFNNVIESNQWTDGRVLYVSRKERLMYDRTGAVWETSLNNKDAQNLSMSDAIRMREQREKLRETSGYSASAGGEIATGAYLKSELGFDPPLYNSIKALLRPELGLRVAETVNIMYRAHISGGITSLPKVPTEKNFVSQDSYPKVVKVFQGLAELTMKLFTKIVVDNNWDAHSKGELSTALETRAKYDVHGRNLFASISENDDDVTYLLLVLNEFAQVMGSIGSAQVPFPVNLKTTGKQLCEGLSHLLPIPGGGITADEKVILLAEQRRLLKLFIDIDVDPTSEAELVVTCVEEIRIAWYRIFRYNPSTKTDCVSTISKVNKVEKDSNRVWLFNNHTGTISEMAKAT